MTKAEIVNRINQRTGIEKMTIACRRIIIEQCQLIDPKYTVRMPNI